MTGPLAAARAELAVLDRRAGPDGPGVARSDAYLDVAGPGLATLRDFLPRYQAWHPDAAVPPLGELLQRYEAQRGISFAALRATADGLGAVGAALDDDGPVRSEVDALHGHWRGPAAERSAAAYGALSTDVRAVADDVRATRDVLVAAVDAVAEQCRGQASWVLEAATDRVGGRSPEDVDVLVAVARGHGTEEQEGRVAAWLLPLSDGVDGAGRSPAAAAVQWLDGVFAPWFSAYLAGFVEVCDATRESVDRSWQVLTAALGAPAGGGAAPDEPGAGRSATTGLASAAVGGATADGWSAGGSGEKLLADPAVPDAPAASASAGGAQLGSVEPSGAGGAVLGSVDPRPAPAVDPAPVPPVTGGAGAQDDQERAGGRYPVRGPVVEETGPQPGDRVAGTASREG